MSGKNIYHSIKLEELYKYLEMRPDVIHSEIIKNSQPIGLLVLYFNEVVHLANIVIYDDYKGRGYAGKILEIITQFSDDQKIVVNLMARVMGEEGGDLLRLVKLYQKFNFNVVEEHPVFMRMVYYPKKQ